MKQLNEPKILAATYNPVSKTKMFTVMIDILYSFLSELLQHKELNVSYKTIENITPNEVLENSFIPVWTEQQKGMSGKGLSEEKVKKALAFLKAKKEFKDEIINSDLRIKYKIELLVKYNLGTTLYSSTLKDIVPETCLKHRVIERKYVGGNAWDRYRTYNFSEVLESVSEDIFETISHDLSKDFEEDVQAFEKELWNYILKTGHIQLTYDWQK